MFKRVYVEITNVCNLACDFCPGTRREKRFLSPEEFRVIAEKLRGHTRYLYFHVMGEPLLHPQLSQLLAIAHQLGFRVCLTTNGTLLPRQAETLLSAPALHKVSVSLHSFEGNGGGDMTDYLAQVWDFCAAAAAKGVLCALRLWNEGGAETRNSEILRFLSTKTGADVESLPRDSVGNRRVGERLYLESARKFDWPSPEAAQGDVQFCHALRQQLAVLCDGTAVPCCLDGEGRMPLGNLFDQSLPEILSAPRAQAIRDGFSRRCPSEELCRRCGYAARFSK